MNCTRCGAAETRVVDSRPVPGGNVTRRKRACPCGCTFHTYEIPGGIWPTVKRWAIDSHATALGKSQALHQRNKQIVDKVLNGEKRYMVAEEFGLSVNMISHITRKAGLPAQSRYTRGKA